MTRAWAKLVWHAFGVAALVVAAELGAAQAFRLIRWGDDFGPGGTSSWSALLTWIGFTYAVAVLAGAAVGRRAVRRPTRPDGAVARILAVLAATAGAAAAVILAWLPSGDVRAPVNVDPRLVVTLTAGAGVLIGAMVALAALSVAPLAVNASTTVVWVWLVAIASALADLAVRTPQPTPRLAVVDVPTVVPPNQWWTGSNLMIGMAVVLGALVALVARWGGGSRPWIAMSGLAGPLIVAAAYLLAGPDTADPGQRGAYYASLIAVAAGLGASSLIALPRHRTTTRDTLAKSPMATRRPAVDPAADLIAPFGSTVLDPPPTRDALDPQPTREVQVTDRPGTGWFGGEAQREAVSDPEPADLQPYVSLASYPGGEPEPTAPTAPNASSPLVIGQPERQFDEEYVDWLSELDRPETTHRGRHR